MKRADEPGRASAPAGAGVRVTNVTGAAIAAGLLALAVMLLSGWTGGRLGERYHRRADSLVARTRPGAVDARQRVVRAS